MNFKEWIDLYEAMDLMNGFKGWYDFNRGNWSEVVAAAKKDPSILNIVKDIRTHMSDLSKAGPWGDKLEAAVERVFPNHSKRKANDRLERQRFGLDNDTQSRTPNGATRTATATATNLHQSPNRPLYNPKQDDTQLSQMVTDHERRLRNLEVFLKGNQNRAQHTVGAMDATASYHR